MADIITGLDKNAGGPKIWTREGRDVNTADNFQTARLIGTVRLEHSRLNAFSSISVGETEDNFKFKVASRGPLRLGKNMEEDNLRVQVYNGSKRIIADSDPTAGRKYDRYLEMISDKGSTADRGNYYIRISRIDSDDTSADSNYTFQLQMGTQVKNDYETIEYKAKELKPGEMPPTIDPTAGAVPSASTLMGQGLSAMLDDAMANFGKMLSGAASILFGGRY